jgi:hypothetical protein
MPTDVRVAYTGSYATCTEVFATSTSVFAMRARVGVAYTGVGDPSIEVFATRTHVFAMRSKVGVASTYSGAMSMDVFEACTPVEEMATDAPIVYERVVKAAAAVAMVYGLVAVVYESVATRAVFSAPGGGASA